MNSYVLGLREMDRAPLSLVGGKGLHLGELTKIAGIHVPDGFCVTTAAFRKITERHGTYRALLDQLALRKADEREAINELNAKIRQTILEVDLPSDITTEVTRRLSRLGEEHAYAVRSSATAEDLPYASFAGQQDSYLNIAGVDSILQHIRQCWASLFTDRAVAYRMQHGFDQRKVHISVIVQRMVFPHASGIMFTADPLTCNRNVLTIEAGFGLGEALVSGWVAADGCKVRDGEIIERRAEGRSPTLSDAQILQLAQIGKRIESHFGQPQDIEWCLAEETFQIVQSRPITTLYPIPETDEPGNRVYVSVGHQQMMTDPMKPLGLSFYLLTTPAPMRTAGGRLFVDVTSQLASPVRRGMLLDSFGKSDPLIKDALKTIIERGFVTPAAERTDAPPPAVSRPPQQPVDLDPSVVEEFMKQTQASIEAVRHTIRSKTGSVLFEFILEDIQRLRMSLFDPRSLGVIMAAMNASAWINEKMHEWLGEKNAADTLSQSVPHNITSQMGLALLDVADAIRPFPEVISYLEQEQDEDVLDGLMSVEGGQEARDAILAFLDAYGMRCSGEIDIARPRWSEKPTLLIPVILGNVRNFEPHAGMRKFEQGRLEAAKKEQELLERLRQLPDGEQKAAETKRKIDFVRSCMGYREYPKYAMVQRYFIYKQALLREADNLIQAGIIREKEDMFYLTFEELRDAVRTRELDNSTISARKAEYEWFEKLTPPRVITSDGEMIAGAYEAGGIPDGALVGLPVSSGVIEGRARVVFRMEEASLDAGDILVTRFTDPSWTPLFVSVAGLVTEVGGLMTHGAVIAREYGLPAVVGVQHATSTIKDGQRIRVHGTEGYIELL